MMPCFLFFAFVFLNPSIPGVGEMRVHSVVSNGEPCCDHGHQGINVSSSLLAFVLFVTLLWGFVTSDRKKSLCESEVSFKLF